MKKNFLYGVSTSAFQIEGDDGTQGRGLSVWDSFCERKGTVYQDENAKIAADHYNRLQEDLDLLAGSNVNAYRFSVSWPRVLPEGTGKINGKGVDFYDRLIDGLLTRGVTPFLTMYHWDLPQSLSDKGGLQNDDFSKWFEEYAALLVKKYGDRVKHYITFNEPINVVHSSYYSGVFAPGYRLNEWQTMQCLHRMLTAHGRARNVIRSVQGSETGMAMSTFEEYPVCGSLRCVEAAKEKFFQKDLASESIDAYLDPVYFGKYPDRLYDKFPALNEKRYAEDLKIICGKEDILCFNNYSGTPVDEGKKSVSHGSGAPLNAMGGAVDPNGLYWGCRFLAERYKAPLYVTENGVACNDIVALDGKVHDENRVDFLERHLAVVRRLIDEKADIRGYFVWSFLDNFEWLFGYTKRFGLVYVDYQTLKRTPKDSYRWYADYIRTHKE